MKSSCIKALSIILIFCLGIIVYSNTFLCSFHFDDGSSIIDNFAIKNISDLQSIWNFLPRRFILYLSIALNYHFHRLDVFGYHVVNLAIHLISAIFVWWLTLLTLATPIMKENKITRHTNLIALFAGLVFVSHPLQTQAVTYIVQRAASMTTLFYLAALCFYIKSKLIQDKQPTSGLGKAYYISSLIITIMSMFTKETAITLPLMILLYEFSFFKTKESFNWRYSLPFLLTLFIIPLTILLTETSPERLQQLYSEPDISPLHYLLTQFRVISTYIRLVVLPINQNLDYDYLISQNIYELPVLFSLFSLIIILFSAKCLISKYRLISFSIFWFFLTLLPESSVLPIKDLIFEHRLYLPLVGYSIFLVSGTYYLLGKNTIKMMIIVLTIIIGCNSVLTYQRNKVWKDDFSLWDDTVKKSPHKSRPYNNRGKAYYDLGNLSQALMDLNKSIEINPNYAEAHYNRATIYAKQDNLTQAMSDFTQAIQINPKYIDAYYNRGCAYMKQSDFIQAISDFTKAIKINPNYAQGYNNLGITYEKQGNFNKAIAHYNKAIEINPEYAEGYNNLGITYEKQGNFIQAILNYNKAIKINPKYAEAYYNSGNAYTKQGNFTQAILNYNKVLKIKPDYAEVYYNLGIIYFKQGHLTQAVFNYSKAIEINPKHASSYKNRAISYYELKEYDKAWADVRKAEQLGSMINANFINALYQTSTHQ